MNSAKLIPQEKKGGFPLFSLEGSSASEIVENLALGFLDNSDNNHGKIKDIPEENKTSLEMHRLIVEFYCREKTLPLKEFIMNLEKRIILRALSKASWNQRIAARFLGIKYTTLNEKIKKYKINFKKNPFFISGYLSK